MATLCLFCCLAINGHRQPTRRTAIRNHYVCCLLFVVPASNNGRRSTARQIFEPECLIGCCFAIERLAAINRATDIRAGVHDCVLFSRSSAERQSSCRTMICIHCALLRALPEPINRKRAFQKPIEEKQSRETESNGDIALNARRTCG